MKRAWILLGLLVVLLAGVATAGYAWAFPSEGFSEIGGDIVDEWHIYRTTAFGENGYYQIAETGFRPVIAFESLGEQANIAYSLGQQIANRYPDQLQRADAVFSFVRDRVDYISDIDTFGSDEFAQNADELATAIAEHGSGEGDCEDMAVLLAVMYKAAGFRSAIMLLPEHTAVLVYLPDYTEATVFFDLAGEPGWIWAEATGRNNPLGWAPEQYLDTEIPTYEIFAETPPYEIPAGAEAPLTPPPTSATAFTGAGEGDGTGERATSPSYLFLIIIGLLLFLSLFRRIARR